MINYIISFNISINLLRLNAKKITKLIKDEFKKVQASIQGDAVRVSAKSKDELQAVMQRLKAEDFPMPLQFTNYR